jgi:hypothetical protein
MRAGAVPIARITIHRARMVEAIESVLAHRRGLVRAREMPRAEQGGGKAYSRVALLFIGELTCFELAEQSPRLTLPCPETYLTIEASGHARPAQASEGPSCSCTMTLITTRW